MNIRSLQRDLYKASRLAGDVNAAQRGTLPTRLIKRAYHRKLISLLRKGGAW